MQIDLGHIVIGLNEIIIPQYFFWNLNFMSSVPTLKIAVIGLGRIGRQHALQLMNGCPQAELVAACSIQPSELAFAQQKLGLAAHHCYSQYADVLALKHVDAVVLATPSSLHADQVEQALAAGKHVFVEKPLSLDVARCLAVERVAARYPSQKVMVGFVRRFDESYQNAYASVQQGHIGSALLVRSQTCDKTDPSGFFVQFSAGSGGIFLDCSVHDIDLARWFLGAQHQGLRAIRAYASGSANVYPELVEHHDVDNGVGIVDFVNDRGDTLQAVIYASRSFAHGHETSTEIIGSKGKLLIGAGAARDRVVLSDQYGVRHQAVEDFWQRFQSAFAREMQAFVDACLDLAPLQLSLADATSASRIGQALRQSLLSKQAVHIVE